MKRRTFLKVLAGIGAIRTAQAADGSRAAIVIGNNGYKTCPPLLNAANDARAMAEVLGRTGFDVSMHIDVPAAPMIEAVKRFGEAIQQPRVNLALFYYAGHGVEIEWRDFLLPIDAEVKDAKDLASAGFEIGRLLSILPRVPDKTFVVVLDACRDNPFGGAYVPERKGLSPFDAPAGSLIAFSTSPGSVASDGTGRNGLYTENLVRELAIPGLRLEDIFKRVRANVSVASHGLQIPWESTSLVRDVYVVPPASPLDEETLERRYEEEVTAWNRVKSSKNPADWAALLRAFPGGRLSEIAQAKLNALLAGSSGALPRGLHGKPARVVLGPGLDVPAYFSRSANPFSAGSYPIDREFRVGDRAIYDGFQSVNEDREERRWRMKVTRVDVDAERVELNDGALIVDLLGNPVREGAAGRAGRRQRAAHVEYNTPFQIVPAELQVGRQWSARSKVDRRGREFDEEMDFRITARETVAVPAGRFDAFRIEAHTSGIRAPFGAGRRARTTSRNETRIVWEVPGLNFPVKQRKTIDHQNGERSVEEMELAGLEQGDPNALKGSG